MDLQALAQAFPDMTVSISLSDLLKSQEMLIEKVRREERKAIENEIGEIDDLIPRVVVQKKLGVDPSTLWRWEKCGYLGAVRIGTKVFYRAKAVNKMLEGKTVSE